MTINLDCYKAKYKTTSEERKNNVQLYFSSKFATDSIPTDLAAKPTPHFKPINYDRWSDLHYKAQELAELEWKNIETIEKVYQRLRDDKEINGRIRGCGWWRENAAKFQSTYGPRTASYVCGSLLA